jgi:hypothetical protein
MKRYRDRLKEMTLCGARLKALREAWRCCCRRECLSSDTLMMLNRQEEKAWITWCHGLRVPERPVAHARVLSQRLGPSRARVQGREGLVQSFLVGRVSA